MNVLKFPMRLVGQAKELHLTRTAITYKSVGNDDV